MQRHSGIGYEIVNLGVLVLQMVEQLPNVLRFFATRLSVVSEQVIDVPKISQDRTQQRLVDYLRQPQTTEQSVEVPTIVSFYSSHWNVEENVDIPVPHGRGGRSSRFTLWTGFNRVFLVEITLTIRFHVVEVFQVSSRDRLLLRHLRTHLCAADEAFKGTSSFRNNNNNNNNHKPFRTYPHLSKKKKNARSGPHSGSELSADLSPSMRRAYGVSVAVEEDESEPVTESELEDEGEISA